MAGESGFATFAVVAVLAALLVARAKVWPTDNTPSTIESRLELVA